MGKKREYPTKDLLTNAPKQEEISVATEMNSKYPFQSEHVHPGNSVDEHKRLEDANQLLNEGEIGQQRENN